LSLFSALSDWLAAVQHSVGQYEGGERMGHRLAGGSATLRRLVWGVKKDGSQTSWRQRNASSVIWDETHLLNLTKMWGGIYQAHNFRSNDFEI